MNIIWHGQSCFTITSKEKFIVIDPFSNKIGLPEPKLKADILLVSHDHPDHANTSIVKKAHEEEIRLISEPGEYEFGGIYIQAILAFHDDKQGKELGSTLLFAIRTEDVVVAHLGNLGQSVLSDGQLEELDGVDVLLIPVGGPYKFRGAEAVKIVTQIDPRIIIPMHYKIPGITINNMEDASVFLAEEGAKELEPKDELKIEKRNLPVEERETVILKPRA